MGRVLATLEAECKDCYKCVRACPVKAIKIDTGHAKIWEERCILDGRCISVCPQGAKQVRDDLGKVQASLAGGRVLVASLAPSYVAAFSVATADQMITALYKLGFSHVAETAAAAEIVAQAHKALLDEHKPIITSSCPAIVNLIEQHYPEAIPYLAPIVSPMIAHGRLLQEQYNFEVEVVFIGPCAAKKAEAEEVQFEGAVSHVLTFQEVEKWLADECIDPKALASVGYTSNDAYWGRSFPLGGGLMRTAGLDTDVLADQMAIVAGIEECESVICQLIEGVDLSLTLIEMLACAGGCVDGPCMVGPWQGLARRQRLLSHVQKRRKRHSHLKTLPPHLDENGRLLPFITRTYRDRKLRLKEPTEAELKAILEAIGKRTPQDELNCGACGYDSCRDKAKAVYHGVAENEMCIPYMRRKAESLANVIIETTPNGIIVVDENLEVLVVNPAAEAMFNCQVAAHLHRPLCELIDTSSFEEVLTKGALIQENAEYPQHNLIVRQYVFTPEDQEIVIGIFSDITEDRGRQAELAQLKSTTLERAQDVINRQMRVAQEIAGLLGETTAETKVLLSQLMKLMQNGDETP
ncbi:MAG: 4Fe-4S binding protein [Firmicutes bacterium]|nr:4Fe-4S binding protein [Bacillota bacterium]